MEWNSKIGALEPYNPNTQPCEIYLNANESFLKLPQEIVDEMARKIQKIPLNRYPDPMAAEVCRTFAEYYGIRLQDVTAGNGSDELISVIFSIFLEKGDRFATLAPDFSMYSFYGQLAQAEEVRILKDKNFQLDIDSVIETCNNRDVKLLIFSNPCNPTSLGISKEEVRRLIQSVKALVVLDEAYMDFWDQSLLGEYEGYDNLIILRTCSKAFALAGLRLGFAVASKEITSILKAAKSPYNVNAMTQKLASVVLSHQNKLNNAIQTIVASKESLYEELLAVQKQGASFEVLESCTNFVSLVTQNPQELTDFIAKKEIAVRLTAGLVRITCGNPAENEAVVSAIREYYQQ
ncbi:pyridoxal phosphate-dependent aminotransferase [Scatolibacter rhodanostii]|uniref:pyridoxal phosphate-dependent aminotransferase n=1 Tax=Scatolibacter rhodanostii TaxID=2014781 RepID=UPI000C07280B|nr:aminotransferase class I/II-fold pyridoxal phosphate-dependent enzyme [Scatolibacter rhodanostii]